MATLGDADGEVPGSCSQCHSAKGLPLLLQEGVTVSQPLSNGLICETCHDAIPGFTRRHMDEVTFPSGATLSTGSFDSNLCINCHQGRESGLTIREATAGLDPDTVAASLRFRNPHYFAAGATLFGTEASGLRIDEGKVYRGRLAHVSSFDTCTECHDAHTLEVNMWACASPFCHGGVTQPQAIRKDTRDFDGDGWKTEGLASEVETLQEILTSAMSDYAANVVGAPIIYDALRTHFFNDSNTNGQVDEGEATASNGFTRWTPRLLLCAAYNYPYVQKDPGAFPHNGKYIIQVLYAGIKDLGTKVTVDMSGMVRL